MSDALTPMPENPIIARLQAQHFAALDAADWDTACDTLRALIELRTAACTLRADIEKEQSHDR